MNPTLDLHYFCLPHWAFTMVSVNSINKVHVGLGKIRVSTKLVVKNGCNQIL